MLKTIKEYKREKAIKYLGLIDSSTNPQEQAERLTFVNDINEVTHLKIKEYNVWYSGDSDEIQNFYTREDMIGYNKDPIYNRNKSNYFWCVASTESDIKRSHSGQPRNIVDTMVNIVGLPKIGSDTKEITARLESILEDNDFSRMFLQEQLPLTLVEGWGCYKINYDSYLRDTPILLYYHAESVDFIYKSNQIIAIIFQDYYQDKQGNNYTLLETRRIERDRASKRSKLIIEKDLFKTMNNSDVVIPCELSNLPELRDVEPVLEINDFNKFLAVPCIIYKDNNNDTYGRSIYTGKIDMFDDLDQCISQAANTVRRSTVQEYFNSNYLEKDQTTGLPVQPKSFDRKYVLFNGGVDANGATAGQEPVHVSQPVLNIDQYEREATSLLLQIISGIMSPATLGIDIAKKDNAEAQREKEKVTIFTRNTIIAEETKILKALMNQLLCAWELMNRGEITVRAYEGIDVKFDEFADSSFEKKLETLLGAFNSGVMTADLFVEMLYKDSLSKEKKDKEKQYIEQQQQAKMGGSPEEEMLGEGEAGAPMSEDDLAMLGAMMGGNNNNDYNRAKAGLDTIASNPEEFAK